MFKIQRFTKPQNVIFIGALVIGLVFLLAQAVTVEGQSCGDGTCDSGEDCSNCEPDCRCDWFDCCAPAASNSDSQGCVTNGQKMGEYEYADHWCCRGQIHHGPCPHKQDGQRCEDASECLNGYCVHGYCRSSGTYCGDKFCEGNENCSSCRTDCPCQQYDCCFLGAPNSDSRGCLANLQRAGETGQWLEQWCYKGQIQQGPFIQKNDGDECQWSAECKGGFCVHNICRSTYIYCGDEFCDDDETCLSCSKDCGICKKYNGERCSKTEECLGNYCVHGYCRSFPVHYGDDYCDKDEECVSPDCQDAQRCQPIKPKDKKMDGAGCGRDEECISGHCENKICCQPGQTCCVEDKNCPENWYCDKYRFYCQAKRGEGAFCNKDEQCLNNRCLEAICCREGKNCCQEDSQCTVLGAYCDIPNRICLAKKENGESCSRASQCLSNLCQAGLCQSQEEAGPLPIIEGTVSVGVDDQEQVLAGVKIELLLNEQVISSVPHYANEAGYWSFVPQDYEKKISSNDDEITVRVTLVSQEELIEVWDEKKKAFPEFTTQPVTIRQLRSKERHEISSTLTDDNAIVYFHIYQAYLFFRDVLKGQPGFVLVHTFSHQPTFYNWQRQIIYINEKDSSRENYNRPENREWHEYSHHIMNCTYKKTIGLPTAKSFSGLGWENETTGQSWVEGLAIFLACWMKEYYYGQDAHIYQGLNIDANIKVWDDEALAVAGILWDIYDELGPEPSDVKINDNVNLDRKIIWSIISQSKREIWDLKDLYDGFAPLFLRAEPGSDIDKDGINDLDEIFIAHGAFADWQRPEEKDSGWRQYNPGEEVGRAADSSRPDRRRRPEKDGSFVKVNLVDRDGEEIFKNVQFSVEIKFDKPYNFYNYSYQRSLSADEELVYLEFPPGYSCQANIKAKVAGYKDPRWTLVIESSDYWQKIEAGEDGYFLEHTFEFGETRKKPQKPWKIVIAVVIAVFVILVIVVTLRRIRRSPVPPLTEMEGPWAKKPEEKDKTSKELKTPGDLREDI